MIAKLTKKIGRERLVGVLDDRGVWRSDDAAWLLELRRFDRSFDAPGGSTPNPAVGRVLAAKRGLGGTIEWGELADAEQVREADDGRTH